MLLIRSYPNGPRCWVAGQRVHHGATGVVLMGAALTNRKLRPLALIGAALTLHDRADWRIWFRRERPPTKEASYPMLPRDPQTKPSMSFRAHTFLLISAAARRGMISGEAATGYRNDLKRLDALPTQKLPPC